MHCDPSSMRDHNVRFHCEIRKIIFESSSIPPLVWSSAITGLMSNYNLISTFLDSTPVICNPYPTTPNHQHPKLENSRDFPFRLANLCYEPCTAKPTACMPCAFASAACQFVFSSIAILPKRQIPSICPAMTGYSASVITWLISRTGFQVT